MPNPVTHFEIVGRDAAALQRFYRELFGWQLRTEGALYSMVHPGAGTGIDGGIGTAPEGGGASRVTVYVEVEDLGATLAEAERLGGRRVVGPTEVPGGPGIALLQDPEGHVIGLVRARSTSA